MSHAYFTQNLHKDLLFRRNRDSSQRTKAGYSIPCAIYGSPVRIERRFLGYRNVWCNFTWYHTCILHKLSVRVRFLAGKPHFHMSLFKWYLVMFIQLGGLWWSDTSCVLLKKWKRNGEVKFKIRSKSTFYSFSSVLFVFCYIRWKPPSLAIKGFDCIVWYLHYVKLRKWFSHLKKMDFFNYIF